VFEAVSINVQYNNNHKMYITTLGKIGQDVVPIVRYTQWCFYDGIAGTVVGMVISCGPLVIISSLQNYIGNHSGRRLYQKRCRDVTWSRKWRYSVSSNGDNDDDEKKSNVDRRSGIAESLYYATELPFRRYSIIFGIRPCILSVGIWESEFGRLTSYHRTPYLRNLLRRYIHVTLLIYLVAFEREVAAAILFSSGATTINWTTTTSTARSSRPTVRR